MHRKPSNRPYAFYQRAADLNHKRIDVLHSREEEIPTIANSNNLPFDLHSPLTGVIVPTRRSHPFRFRNPTRRTNKHSLVNLHAQIVCLPIKCHNVWPRTPKYMRMEIWGSETQTLGIYSSHMSLPMNDECVQYRIWWGKEGKQRRFRNIEKYVRRVRDYWSRKMRWRFVTSTRNWIHTPGEPILGRLHAAEIIAHFCELWTDTELRRYTRPFDWLFIRSLFILEIRFRIWRRRRGFFIYINH